MKKLPQIGFEITRAMKLNVESVVFVDRLYAIRFYKGLQADGDAKHPHHNNTDANPRILLTSSVGHLQTIAEVYAILAE